MRATTLLSKILGLKATHVRGVTCDGDGLVVAVVPTTRIARCSGCRCRVRAVHDRRERDWRHLDVGPFRVWLRYALRRVNCRRCGVVVEFVPWAESPSWFNYDFEEQVAYLAQRADKTTLSTLMRVAWRTVRAILERAPLRRRASLVAENILLRDPDAIFGAAFDARADKLLGECDVVFVSDGDVERGMNALNDRGIAEPLRAHAARGKPMLGISAGSPC